VVSSQLKPRPRLFIDPGPVFPAPPPVIFNGRLPRLAVSFPLRTFRLRFSTPPPLTVSAESPSPPCFPSSPLSPVGVTYFFFLSARAGRFDRPLFSEPFLLEGCLLDIFQWSLAFYKSSPSRASHTSVFLVAMVRQATARSRHTPFFPLWWYPN